MKDEYDFSTAERGRFAHAEAEFDLPIYLEPGIRRYLAERAKAQGVEVGQLVNDLLRLDIDRMETSR